VSEGDDIRHADQLWWPDLGLRKRDAVDYYRAVAPAILPHVRGRPFTMKRHYNGPRSPFVWLKDAPPELPESVPRCPLPAKSRRGGLVEYPVVEDVEALVWMVDFGCVDMHLWLSRCATPSEPDYVLFDIDPPEFGDAVRTAHAVRAALDALGLDSLVKTSGGDGLHVLVPLGPGHTYPQTREFARIVAGALGADVDTKMNGEGMTIASVYSLRPLPGAPVSTPLAWDELDPALDPRRFTPAEVLRRVEEHGDLFEPVLHGTQRLDDALARLA
jgi:bifunctional non-homologous end joining protein LigD